MINKPLHQNKKSHYENHGPNLLAWFNFNPSMDK